MRPERDIPDIAHELQAVDQLPGEPQPEHDVSGRLHRSLVNRAIEAGSHVVVWNGRDDRGIDVQGGMYFLRLEANARVLTHRVIVVR